jgi:hypothetical protein
MNPFRQAALAAAIAGGIAATALPAAAEQMCFLRDQAIDNLRAKYGENVSARGISGDGKAMYELLTSDDGSWTLLMTRTDGKTCMVGSGEAWTAVTAVKDKGPAV